MNVLAEGFAESESVVLDGSASRGPQSLAPVSVVPEKKPKFFVDERFREHGAEACATCQRGRF